MLIHGDCLEKMKEMQDCSIDFVVCDPPYGLSFMSKKWDKSTPNVEIWKEALRICKPGSMLAAFGGSRTHHHLMIALEQAGWEIRDVIMWLHGQGFPKNLNIGKAIDKCGGNTLFWFPDFIKNERLKRNLSITEFAELLQPAFPEVKDLYRFIKHWEDNSQRPTNEKFNAICKILCLPFDDIEEAEREILALKKRTISHSSCQFLKCYTEVHKITKSCTELAKKFEGYGTALKPAYELIIICQKPLDGTYAQNAEKWGVSGINIDASRILPVTGQRNLRWPANIILDEVSAEMIGLPSRFFFCAKASSAERNKGLEGMPLKNLAGSNKWTDCDYRKGTGEITAKGSQNNHPTVKPISLMKYIIKLLAPPGDPICLDPFAGSGTTLLAAKELGIRAIGIEIEKDYFDIAEKRLA